MKLSNGLKSANAIDAFVCFPPHPHGIFAHPRELFAALDRCEGILAGQRYLVGDQLTEADLRLFVTLIRFDEVCGRGSGGL